MLVTLGTLLLFGLRRAIELWSLRIQILWLKIRLFNWQVRNYFLSLRISSRATARRSTKVRLSPRDLLEAGLLNGSSTSMRTLSRRPIGERELNRWICNPENYLAVLTATGKMVLLYPTLISLISGDSSTCGMWMIPTRGADPSLIRPAGTQVITITLS